MELPRNDPRVSLLKHLMEQFPFIAELILHGPDQFYVQPWQPGWMNENSNILEVASLISANSLPPVRRHIDFGLGIEDVVKCTEDGQRATGSKVILCHNNTIEVICVRRPSLRYEQWLDCRLGKATEEEARQKEYTEETMISLEIEFRNNSKIEQRFDYYLDEATRKQENERFWAGGDFCLQRLFCEARCPTAPIMFTYDDVPLLYLRYLIGDPTLGEGIETKEEWDDYFQHVRN